MLDLITCILLSGATHLQFCFQIRLRSVSGREGRRREGRSEGKGKGGIWVGAVNGELEGEGRAWGMTNE